MVIRRLILIITIFKVLVCKTLSMDKLIVHFKFANVINCNWKFNSQLIGGQNQRLKHFIFIPKQFRLLTFKQLSCKTKVSYICTYNFLFSYIHRFSPLYPLSEHSCIHQYVPIEFKHIPLHFGYKIQMFTEIQMICIFKLGILLVINQFL